MSAIQPLEVLLRDAPLPLIAGRVRKARRSAGLSHDRLCERCDMYRANLIRLEQGKHRPRMATLERIASATNRDVRWFLDPEADPSPFPDEEDADGDR